MADEELKLKLVLDAQEARAELKKVRAEAGKPVKVSAPSPAAEAKALERELRKAEAAMRRSVAQQQAGVGPGRHEYKQAQAYERQQRRMEAAGQAGVGPGRPEFKLQKEEQANAKKRQAAAEQMQQRAKAGARKIAQDEERDKKKALAQIPMAKAAKETDKAAKSLSAFDKVLLRAGGGGGGISRLLGALGGGGGGGAAGGAVVAIQLLKAGAEKAADIMKRIYAYGREGAAMLNPRGEQTLQLHKRMFQMESGRGLLGNQRAEANLAEKGTRAMERFNEWLQSPQGGKVAAAAFGRAGGWQHSDWVRRNVPLGASLQNAFNQAPQAQAGFGPAQQFDDMAAWHRAVTQSNLSMGLAERREWRKTAQTSLGDWNAPRNDPNKWLADDDAVSRIVDAITAMNAGLNSILLRGIGG